MEEFYITEGLRTGSHWTWNTKERGKPIIAVDFDHTITDGCTICSGNVVDTQHGVVEAMKKLHETFKIVIYIKK